MVLPLFRRQVTERQGERLWGDLILRQPLSFKLLSTFIGLITLSAGVFLWFNHYPRSEQVTGFLVPKQGIIQVSPPGKGLVAALHVNEGEQVIRNQALLSLVANQLADEKGSVTDSLIKRLVSQQKNLGDQIELEKKTIASIEQAMMRQETNIEQEIELLKSLHKGELERLALRVKANERTRNIYKRGVVTEVDAEKVRELLLQQKNIVDGSSLRLLGKQSELEAKRTHFQTEQIRAEKQILQLKLMREKLEQEIVRYRFEAGHQVNAPVAGTISSVAVEVGQSLNPAQNILTIIPENSNLQAVLLIPSRAAGLVETGQEVVLRYEAFPYQKFGVFHGRLVSVSEALALPENGGAELPQNDYYYRAIVRLDKQTVHAYGREYPLKPGMKVNAELIMERRSLMEWLFDPINRIRRAH